MRSILHLDQFQRQSTICPPEKLPEIMMVGAGHLGSMICMSVTQIGVGASTAEDEMLDSGTSNLQSAPVVEAHSPRALELVMLTASTATSAARLWRPAWMNTTSNQSLKEILDGTPLTCFDPDVVEPHNVAASFYTYDQALAKAPKVQALVSNINMFMDVHMVGVMAKLTSNESMLDMFNKPVLIISTDSRSSRLEIWSLLNRFRNKHHVELLIDARSGWDVTRVYTCRMDNKEDREHYTASLSREGQQIPCSARAVAYNSIGVGSTVAGILKSYALHEPVPRHVLWDYKTWTTVIQI